MLVDGLKGSIIWDRLKLFGTSGNLVSHASMPNTPSWSNAVQPFDPQCYVRIGIECLYNSPVWKCIRRNDLRWLPAGPAAAGRGLRLLVASAADAGKLRIGNLVVIGGQVGLHKILGCDGGQRIACAVTEPDVVAQHQFAVFQTHAAVIPGSQIFNRDTVSCEIVKIPL